MRCWIILVCIGENMAEFTGKCLCGQVSYKSHVKPTLILNCHCEDCRRSTGAVYSTNVFVEDDKVEIIGTTSAYSPIAKSGNMMTKHFCENCGSLMLTSLISSSVFFAFICGYSVYIRFYMKRITH